MCLERIDSIVVGAGVIGLAIARALALRGDEVVILESASVFGSETSSRNSEVIHAGIYYPKDSYKAQLCVLGKQALYEFCAQHGVSHRRVGKLLVAVDETQLEALEEYRLKGVANGVHDLQPLTSMEVRDLEPEVRCVGGLWSPSSGIVSAHEYMLALLGEAENHGATVVFNSPFLRAEIRDNGFCVYAGGSHPTRVLCNTLVNAAGLRATAVASHIDGVPRSRIPQVFYAKGNYFHLTTRSPFRHLVYPLPARGSLGVHVSFDLGGRCRFGPDIHWVNEIEYNVDTWRVEAFYDAVRCYWPGLPDNALAPDYVGIRPKLAPEGEPATDFVIQTHRDHGIQGLVNLFGIESPGLTSSLAIADQVLRSI